MKFKLMNILIIMVMLFLVACKGKDTETHFIPTLPPEYKEEDDISLGDDDTDIPEDSFDEFEEATDDIPDDDGEEPAYVGETTTKYVKLRSYGAILNVRSQPSTEGDNVVGFLVHTEPVQVISIEDGWAKILYLGEIRYVSADYLVDNVPPYVSPPTLTTPEN